MTENGVTTVYLAVGHKTYYEVTDNQSTKHIYAGERKIAEVKGGVTSYLHNDHQGSVKVITDASGTVVATMDTKPFGEPYPAATAPPTDYLYTGKELDDSGLYYYAARYYDPKLGRFTVPDTWEGELNQPLSQNLYVYVTNSPVNYVDPTGNVPVLVVAAGIWTAYEFISGAYDVYNAARTIRDPGATSFDKSVAAGGAILSVFGPGGGYGKAGKEVVESVAKGTGKAYRYVSESELNVIKKTGTIPNTDRAGNLKDVFVSPNKYNSITDAERGLQIGSKIHLGLQNHQCIE